MSSVSASDTTEIGGKTADLRALKAQINSYLNTHPDASSDLREAMERVWLAADCALNNRHTQPAARWLRKELERFNVRHG